MFGTISNIMFVSVKYKQFSAGGGFIDHLSPVQLQKVA